MTTGSRMICIVGNANIDLVAGSIPDWPAWGTEVFLSRSDFRIGGSAANTASVLRRLDRQCGLISACGDDEPGQMILRCFSGPLDRVRVLPKRTSMSVAILQENGERCFFSTKGHLDDLDADFFRSSLADVPLRDALVLLSGAFALPGLIGEHTELLTWLKTMGAEIAIDPGWPGCNWSRAEIDLARAWMAASDHLLFNEMEVLGLSGETTVEEALVSLSPIVASGARLVVKQGPKGASLWRDGTVVHALAASFEVIDTVGAGDAFNAGYLAAIACGTDDLAAIEAGIRSAGHVISEFPRGSGPIRINR